jgi:hemerythrin-like metal-binding protein
VRYIPWNPALETGYDEVDTQHRALYALVNDLNAAALVGVEDPEQIAHQVNRILRYATLHFETEASLMARSSYPRATEHLAVHADFSAKAVDLARAQAEGSGSSVLELAVFMQDWLELHIHEQDRPLVEHVRAWIVAEAHVS